MHMKSIGAPEYLSDLFLSNADDHSAAAREYPNASLLHHSERGEHNGVADRMDEDC
jgi:hypothetical protein